MKSKGILHEPTPDLFRSELKNILNLRHELCVLAELIDWERLDEEIGKLFPSTTGCPALPTQLIMGLFYLKATYKTSDEAMPRCWIENPYWQYFCGEQYLQHEFPMDPSSLSQWRKRLKESDVEKLLAETIQVGLKTKVIKKRDIKIAVADTTVQEKAITFSTDSKLYQRGRELLVKEAEKHGIKLKQNYKRLAKKVFFQGNNYVRAKQMNRAQKEFRKLKVYLRRVKHQIQKHLENKPELQKYFSDLIEKVDRVLIQQKEDKNKLYSFHAPEVECIGKGKIDKRYEFGIKASLIAPLKKNFIVGAKALPNNPYDGHTLVEALDQVERLTGIRPDECVVDLGYRGHEETKTTIHITRHKKNKKTSRLRAMMRRRNSIEAIIGHSKNDCHLGGNYLKGSQGDKLNVLFSAIGFNLQAILRWLRFFLALYFVLYFWDNWIIKEV